MIVLPLLLLLGAYGVHRTAIRLGAEPIAAAWAGALYALQGAMVLRWPQPTAVAVAALLPWIYWLADRTVVSAGASGMPSAAGMVIVFALILRSGHVYDAYFGALFVALYVMLKRPRKPVGLALGSIAPAAVFLWVFYSRSEDGSGLLPPYGDLPLALFPYFAPGRLAEQPPSFVGIVALGLSATAMLTLPARRTLPLLAVIVAPVLWGVRNSILQPDALATPSPVFIGLGVALLAAVGLTQVLRGFEHRASVAQRNALGVLTGGLGLACFHAITLYLRGGERPGEAPSLVVGIVLAGNLFAAALCPLLTILRGEWTARRRRVTMLIAMAALVEILVMVLAPALGWR